MNRIEFEGVGMTSKRTRDRLIQRLVDQGISDQTVLDVIANTPRHLFVDEALAHRAYEDTALPIGYSQTISQPYIVARMTESLLAAGGAMKKVLEIGTGSGYQTAILAQFVEELWSLERIKPLQDRAKRLLNSIGLRNINFKCSDGGLGYEEAGPYNGILSAAAPREVPKGLLKQLAPDGVLVIPLGAETQELTLIIREGESDSFKRQVLEQVKFVPLLSGVSR